MAAVSGWAHVTLSVRDHDRSVRWYEEVLGFKPAATDRTQQWTRTLCVHPDSGIILVLQENTSCSDKAFDERQPGLDHLALAVPARSDLDEWRHRLDSRGVVSAPIADTGRGAWVLSFRDPDGIALELFFRPQATA